MNPEKIIKQGIGVVALILAAFGGFLVGIAPPENAKAGFSVGVSSLILLACFLLFRLISEYKWSKGRRLKLWIALGSSALGLFLIATYFYYIAFSNNVYKHGDGSVFVKGSRLTPSAETTKAAIINDERTCSEQRLLKAFGNPHTVGVLEEVWESSTIEDAKSQLVLRYILLVVTIGCSLLAFSAYWSSVKEPEPTTREKDTTSKKETPRPKKKNSTPRTGHP
jgi:hypothetical protein